MNRTKTKKSKTEDLYELIKSFSEEETAGLLVFATRKKKDPEYLKLFTHLKQLSDEQKLLVEQIHEPSIKVAVVGPEQEQWSAYRSLCRNLYKILVAYLAEAHLKKEANSWRPKVNRGLDEVEALSDRRFFAQAAAKLAQLEALIPSNPERYAWNDLWPITRLALLKFFLKDQVDFLSMTKDQEMMMQLSSLTGSFRQTFSTNQSESMYSRLKAEGEQMFLFRLLNQMDSSKEKDKRRLKVLNAAIKRHEPKEGVISIIQKHKKDIQNSAFKTRLLRVYFYRLSLRKVGLLLDMGQLQEALDEINNFRKSSKGDLSFATTMLVSTQQGEIGLARAINVKKELPASPFEAKFFYTDNLIEDMPIRIEFNGVLAQAYSENYKEAHRRTQVLLKERVGRTARKSMIIELKLLDTLLQIELAAEKGSFKHETIRQLNDAIKNHNGNPFEKLARKVLEELGSWATHRFEQQQWLKQNETLLQKLRDASNLSNPLHQFFLFWIGRLKDWDESINYQEFGMV